MKKKAKNQTSGSVYGPVEIDRRTVTKLAGMAGIAVFAPTEISSVEATETNGRTQAMNIQPLYDRVLLQRVESEERTDSGIIVPGSAQEAPQEGIARATGEGPVGEDGEPIPLRVSEGDKVLFDEDAGIEVNIAGEEHVIISEDDILAIIND